MSQLCTADHVTRIDGRWVVPSTSTIEKLTTANGQLQYRVICNKCRERSVSMVLPSRVAKNLIRMGHKMIERVNPPGDRTPCSHLRCNQAAAEWHHYAPRNVFGVEADDWPVQPLCLAHHREWHDRMDGYRVNAPRVVAS